MTSCKVDVKGDSCRLRRRLRPDGETNYADGMESLGARDELRAIERTIRPLHDDTLEVLRAASTFNRGRAVHDAASNTG